MNFGLSGSMDWMFELLESIGGLKLALHDPAQPDLRIEPNLPSSFRGSYSLRRIYTRPTAAAVLPPCR